MKGRQREIMICHCGIEFIKSVKQRKHCSIKCQVVYQRRKPGAIRASRESDKRRMESLPDSMVKKSIYIASEGNIKYDQMTMEMIKEKRQSLIEYRERPKNYRSCKVYFPECEICGEIFTATYKDTKHCSDKCRRKNKQLMKTGDSRKRARQFGVKYEYINPLKVFMRDGWHCQICGKATPIKNRGKFYPNAPELDHRIPLSKGGGHLYSNVQCACRKCNGQKSNKDNRGQMPLFEIAAVAR